MPSNIVRVTLLLALLTAIQGSSIGAQTIPKGQEQAADQALLFVRGNASEELRTVPAEDITVDATRLPNVPTSISDPQLASLGSQLRVHIVRGLDAKCAQSVAGLTKMQALFARAECVTSRSRYYVETEPLQIGRDTAIVIVHVFRRPTQPDRPHVSRIDYAGYKVELLRQANEWGKPRIVSITET